MHDMLVSEKLTNLNIFEQNQDINYLSENQENKYGLKEA